MRNIAQQPFRRASLIFLLSSLLLVECLAKEIGETLVSMMAVGRQHLVITQSGVMGQLQVKLNKPVGQRMRVQLRINKPQVAGFRFCKDPSLQELIWDNIDWQTPRTVVIGVADGGDGLSDSDFEVSAKWDAGSDILNETNEVKVRGIVIRSQTGLCFPDAVHVGSGALSQPYGSDQLSYTWTVQHTDRPVALSIKGSAGSAIFVTQEGQKVESVIGEQQVGCSFILPRDKVVPIYLDTYADSSFGLRHSRYEFLACNSSWQQVKNTASFSPRDGTGAVVFKDKLWLVGGWDGEKVLSEVWNSADGSHWSQVTAKAPWSPRHGAGVVVFQDKLWLISGEGCDDVWSSDDGIDWRLVASGTPWGKRYCPSVFSFAGKLWLMGGQWWSDAACSANAVIGYNDVWSSEDGANWTQVSAVSPWSPRSLVHGTVVHRDRMWIIGGGLKGAVNGTSKTLAEYNDIWSTEDGVKWRLECSNAKWQPRTHFSLAEFDDEIWVTDGSIGRQDDQTNEVWRSTDGVHWNEDTMVPWSGRHASSLVVFHGNLWLIAGRLYNDVWSFSRENRRLGGVKADR